MRLNNRGSHHIFFMIIIGIIAVLLLSILSNRHASNADRKGPDADSQSPSLQKMQPATLEESEIADPSNFILRPEDLRMKETEAIINSAVETQTELLKMKAEAI